MQVITSKHSGFCNGVKRSLKLLDEALMGGSPVFLTGEIVHNTLVQKSCEDRGVKIIGDITRGSSKSPLLIAAHGATDEAINFFKKNFKDVIDGTCPVVSKRKSDISKDVKDGACVVLFVKNITHSEVVTLINNISDEKLHIIQSASDLDAFIKNHKDAQSVVVHTQTTFPRKIALEFIETLNEHFDSVDVKSEICKDCLNRQRDVINHIDDVDALIVVGSSHSSNANELTRIAKDKGKDAFIVESPNDVSEHFYKYSSVYVISSASSSESVFEQIVQKLQNR